MDMILFHIALAQILGVHPDDLRDALFTVKQSIDGRVDDTRRVKYNQHRPGGKPHQKRDYGRQEKTRAYRHSDKWEGLHHWLRDDGDELDIRGRKAVAAADGDLQDALVGPIQEEIEWQEEIAKGKAMAQEILANRNRHMMDILATEMPDEAWSLPKQAREGIKEMVSLSHIAVMMIDIALRGCRSMQV